ncbi:MAG: RagB/SusD family nutrient uptake outer membrane protein, partial [Muribaculaceae bacterium]|nr:RagB/SusD family nutrient uptake outer membrane protein [Muribaculaceae bacterium]
RKHYTLFFDDPYDPDEVLYHGMTWAQLDSINHFNKRCYWRKYSQVDSHTGRTEIYSGDVNCRMIRLAEIYLNYGEIMNELNDRSTAVEYINKVRRRANMADLTASSFANRDQLLDQIKHERVMELCSECLRWPDLDRWGDLYNQASINEIAQRDADFNTFTLGKSNLYPIPQREIDYYPGLTQNPNY